MRIVLEKSHHKYRNYRKMLKAMRMTPWVLGTPQGREFSVKLLQHFQTEVDDAHAKPRSKFLVARMKDYLGIQEESDAMKEMKSIQEQHGPVVVASNDPRRRNNLKVYDDGMEEVVVEDFVKRFAGDIGNDDFEPPVPGSQPTGDDQGDGETGPDALSLKQGLDMETMTKQWIKDTQDVKLLHRKLEQANQAALLRFSPQYTWKEEDLAHPDVADRVLRLYNRMLRSEAEYSIAVAPIIDYGSLSNVALKKFLNTMVQQSDRVHFRSLKAIAEAEHRVT